MARMGECGRKEETDAIPPTARVAQTNQRCQRCQKAPQIPLLSVRRPFFLRRFPKCSISAVDRNGFNWAALNLMKLVALPLDRIVREGQKRRQKGATEKRMEAMNGGQRLAYSAVVL